MFHDPERVEQLRAQGITPDRSAARPPPPVQVTMTSNGPRVTNSQIFSAVERVERVARQAATSPLNASPRTSLELVEECARLRAEIDRLRQENRQLVDECARLRGAGAAPRALPAPRDLDDAERRFSLLELDLE